jgi:hypothetical protein
MYSQILACYFFVIRLFYHTVIISKTLADLFLSLKKTYFVKVTHYIPYASKYFVTEYLQTIVRIIFFSFFSLAPTDYSFQ